MTAAWCGPFTADPQVPPDYWGRHYCANCKRAGKNGDGRHGLPDVEEQQESRRRAGDDSDDDTEGVRDT